MADLTLEGKDGKLFEVRIIERQYYEPAIYATELGFICEDEQERLWFVADDGRADIYPSDEVGWIMNQAVCPLLEMQQSNFEARYEWQQENKNV